jgi:hypothetical protein
LKTLLQLVGVGVGNARRARAGSGVKANWIVDEAANRNRQRRSVADRAAPRDFTAEEIRRVGLGRILKKPKQVAGFS